MFVANFNDPSTKPDMQIFDSVGTTMKSICDCIENDFEDFTNRSMIQIQKRYSNAVDEYLTHTKYNVAFIHDHGPNIRQISESAWVKFEGKYTKRVEQWREIMNEKEKTLFFVRLGADERKILNAPYFTEENEKFYLEKFADMMKAKGLKYYILELSSSYSTGYDKDRNIIYVNFPAFPMQKVIGGLEIGQIIKKNFVFIRNCIYKPETINVISQNLSLPDKTGRRVAPPPRANVVVPKKN
jgi:hypothetical protein